MSPHRFETRTTGLWAPYVEWSIEHDGWSGNPFDVVATATFEHESGATRETELFYDPENEWSFRFTGSKPGHWTFVTSSDVADLDGHSGAIEVDPEPGRRGFLTHEGNRFAVQVDEGETSAYLFNVYMDAVEHTQYLSDIVPQVRRGFHMRTGDAVERALDYLDTARENGFEVIWYHVLNSWFRHGAKKHSDHERANPDPVTFEVLERMIEAVHAAGGRVHLWSWGDEEREWTPIGLPGGINGEADRRLQRYIAARLGPIPGWTMGYGFDLHEWATHDEVNEWADYLHERFGWDHLLAARGYELEGETNNVNSYDGFGRDLVDLYTTESGPRNYEEVAEDLDGDPGRPHLYEERHTFRRAGSGPGFDLTMAGTRRILWWQAMAGGFGGWYGFYEPWQGSHNGHPYPDPQQLRTHHEFWRGRDRFRLDLERANDLTDGYALASPDRDRFVFYAEDADSIRMDLSAADQPLSAVGVDTTWQYDEIQIGTLEPEAQVWDGPYESDWAIAVGSFD